MIKQETSPRIPLPRGWPQSVKTAMVHVILLAQFGMAHTRGWAVNGPIARMRLKTDNERLRQQVALLKEEIILKDVRMMRIAAHKRPHYGPTGRRSILELRVARGWSTQRTANVFLVTAAKCT